MEVTVTTGAKDVQNSSQIITTNNFLQARCPSESDLIKDDIYCQCSPLWVKSCYSAYCEYKSKVLPKKVARPFSSRPSQSLLLMRKWSYHFHTPEPSNIMSSGPEISHNVPLPL